MFLKILLLVSLIILLMDMHYYPRPFFLMRIVNFMLKKWDNFKGVAGW